MFTSCLNRSCLNSQKCVTSRFQTAVRPFGLRRPATAVVSPQHLCQQQLRSLCVAHSFEGDAGKALKEAAALDELLDVLLEAKSQQEVRKAAAAA